MSHVTKHQRHHIVVIIAAMGLLLLARAPAAWAWRPGACTAGGPPGTGPVYRAPMLSPYATLSHEETAHYAYGWFGVAPRQHMVRQFGYYRNYTQWRGQ